MNLLKTITLLGLGASLTFANMQQKNNPEIKEVIQKGHKTTQLLLKTLGSNMKKQMKSGGPMQALDFCSNEAYTLTEKVNTQLEKGVSVKRISLKYRNPLNKPAEDEAKILHSLESLQKENVILPKHIIEKVDEHTYKVYKPLVIKKQVCLKCHGDVTNQKLKKAINERYPEDKAQHYKMGDLRGAVVVTVDTSAK